jgi:SAM-dependent methyltransferase
VRRLVGIDLSPDMLRVAQDPVCREEICIGQIELICGNVFDATFAGGSFNFIYSLGMFGHGCPVTIEICNRFYHWLAPGGRLLFNTVDNGCFSLDKRVKLRVRSVIYPALPRRFQEALDRREGVPFFGLTKRELERVLNASRFREFTVQSRVCESPLWNGSHLECLARKA